MVLVALGLAVHAAMSLHVVEAHDVPEAVRARVVEALCAGLSAHTDAAVACERTPAPGEDYVAVRMYAGATQLLVRCDALVGLRGSSASVELPLGGRESWRDRMQGLWPVLLPALSVSARGAAPDLRAAPDPRVAEPPWIPWALGAGSVASAAVAAVFVGLALDAQSDFEATQRSADEEAALLSQIDVRRGVAIGLVATAVVTAAAAIVAAAWDSSGSAAP